MNIFCTTGKVKYANFELTLFFYYPLFMLYENIYKSAADNVNYITPINMVCLEMYRISYIGKSLLLYITSSISIFNIICQFERCDFTFSGRFFIAKFGLPSTGFCYKSLKWNRTEIFVAFLCCITKIKWVKCCFLYSFYSFLLFLVIV